MESSAITPIHYSPLQLCLPVYLRNAVVVFLNH